MWTQIILHEILFYDDVKKRSFCMKYYSMMTWTQLTLHNVLFHDINTGHFSEALFHADMNTDHSAVLWGPMENQSNAPRIISTPKVFPLRVSRQKYSHCVSRATRKTPQPCTPTHAYLEDHLAHEVFLHHDVDTNQLLHHATQFTPWPHAVHLRHSPCRDTKGHNWFFVCFIA